MRRCPWRQGDRHEAGHQQVMTCQLCITACCSLRHGIGSVGQGPVIQINKVRTDRLELTEYVDELCST